MLRPTPPDRLVDAEGRPYFLWDCDVTLADFRRKLTEGDDEDRAYWLGKLMRQAKPDDVFTFARPEQIAALWPRLQRHLGRTLSMWRWLLETWKLLP